MITENIRQSEQGSYVSLEPLQIQKILINLKKAVERSVSLGQTPVILTSPIVRKHFKKISEQLDTELVILSYNELEQNVEIFSDGVVNL